MSAESLVREAYKEALAAFSEYSLVTFGFRVTTVKKPTFTWRPGDGWYQVEADGSVKLIGKTAQEAAHYYAQLRDYLLKLTVQ